MKLLRTISLFALLLLLAGPDLSAQPIKDPTTWTFTAKRKYGNVFEIHFHVKLKDTWHISSLQPGGDGMMIAPSFNITPMSNLKLRGPVKETGKPVEENVDGVGKLRYFKGEADFVQEVEIGGSEALRVAGKLEYQVCNDRTCLPPKTKAFIVDVRP